MTWRVWIVALAFFLAAGPSEAKGAIPLAVQTRKQDGAVERKRIELDPATTAVVVIDMWDKHWCRTYTGRVANLVPRMNRALDAARKLGIPVVFVPSDVVSFFAEFPQRKAMLSIPSYPEPAKTDLQAPPPPGPTDRCECGPDRPCKPGKAWTRQHPDLKIAPPDWIGDGNDGRELLNFCRHRGIRTLVYLGVASNICVQYRSMGLRNMKQHGLQVLVVSDLVQAISANGIGPDGKPDRNFTPAAGSAQVQRHIERDLAPTIESRTLIAAAGMDPHAADKRPHVVFVSGEEEYETHKTLPQFAGQTLGADFRCTFLNATGPELKGHDDVPGLEAVDDADLLVLSMRRRALPVVQMDHLERYIRAGKPLVALRVSAAAFQLKTAPPRGCVVWDRFDQEVLGCNYQGYNPKSRQTGCDVWIVNGSAAHPILQGVAAKFHSPSWIYRQRPTALTATPLLAGRWSSEDPEEPVAWTNSYQGARVFYTTLGHPGDFQLAAFQRLLRNAICWAADWPGTARPNRSSATSRPTASSAALSGTPTICDRPAAMRGCPAQRD
jgi:nicotinamidase-related amidase/type 1 glutamine amidotransferase